MALRYKTLNNNLKVSDALWEGIRACSLDYDEEYCRQAAETFDRLIVSGISKEQAALIGQLIWSTWYHARKY